MSGKVTYVVLSYGRQDLTMKCLTSFRKFHGEDPVIVADNGGPNGEMTKKLCEMFNAGYVVNPLNDSLSKLMNLGVEAAQTEYVCIVTNGVEFTTRLTEQFEKDFEKDPLTVVVGGLLMYSDGRIQHGGGRRFWNHNAMGHYGQTKYPHQAKMCLNTAYRLYVTGATAAIRKDFWQENRYDENLTMSCEDTDICFRAWKAGKRVFYDPEITSIHNEGSTRGNTPEQKMKNAPWAFEREQKTLALFRAKYSDADCLEMDREVNRLNVEIHPELPLGFIRHGAVGDVLRALEVYDKIVEEIGPCVVITGVPEAFRDRSTVAITDQVDEYAVSGFIDLDMTYERDRSKPITESYYRAVNFPDVDTSIKPISVKATEADWMTVRKQLPEMDWEKSFAVIHAGVGWPGKTVGPHIWREIALKLIKSGLKVICVGAGQDISATGEGVYSLVGKTTLHGLRALCERAKVFVGSDSGPLHVADGACPAIGLFTVARPENLVSPGVIGFLTGAECAGCLARQPLTTAYKCEFGPGDPRAFMCTQMFDSEAIGNKALEVMRK